MCSEDLGQPVDRAEIVSRSDDRSIDTSVPSAPKSEFFDSGSIKPARREREFPIYLYLSPSHLTAPDEPNIPSHSIFTPFSPSVMLLPWQFSVSVHRSVVAVLSCRGWSPKHSPTPIYNGATIHGINFYTHARDETKVRGLPETVNRSGVQLAAVRLLESAYEAYLFSIDSLLSFDPRNVLRLLRVLHDR
ncbi:hypothetical protein SISNIDRAFT_490331 [Sistotremastrum niveocremeum HHB9708]|uniref:Uncharacterized protein n=1 Tax=Sistotremastrum niveocremeum HHB9708 TaxID=1314777 RepID=A0A164P3J5_9AGAM|nr:hypothetical protein SISNIDRAFT_490331 [Sistotremastrum niveocremeum HHB9708]